MNAVALHHVADGPPEAPPLLLGGSLGSDLEMWRPQVAALAAQHRVVRFDHRGHGRSPVPPGPYAIEDLGADVLRLLDTLGVDTGAAPRAGAGSGAGAGKVDYAGLSLGGMVGMWLAATAPQPRYAEHIAASIAGSRLAVLDHAAHLANVERADAVNRLLLAWFGEEGGSG